MDLDKLNLLTEVQLMAFANFHCCPRCLKKWKMLQSGQKGLKNNQLDSLVEIRDTLSNFDKTLFVTYFNLQSILPQIFQAVFTSISLHQKELEHT